MLFNSLKIELKNSIYCRMKVHFASYRFILCAVWHNPGHQLLRSLHLHSMEHPLSVNMLMGGKLNNTEGRKLKYTQTTQK